MKRTQHILFISAVVPLTIVALAVVLFETDLLWRAPRSTGQLRVCGSGGDGDLYHCLHSSGLETL